MLDWGSREKCRCWTDFSSASRHSGNYTWFFNIIQQEYHHQQLSMDVQVKSLLNFSLPAVWTCAAWVSLSPTTINTSSIDVQDVSSQSGTGMNRNADYVTSPVPELGDPVRFRNAPLPEFSGTDWDTGCRNADAQLWFESRRHSSQNWATKAKEWPKHLQKNDCKEIGHGFQEPLI